MGHVARVAEKKETYKLLAIRPEPKRLIEELGERCENDIKKDFRTFDWRDKAGLIWFMIRTGGGLL